MKLLGFSLTFYGVIGVIISYLYYLVHDQFQWGNFEYVEYYPKQNFYSNVYTRSEVFIPTNDPNGNFSLHGWLILPKKLPEGKLSLLVLSHGLGAQKDMGLEQYGRKFVDSGYAAFIFDYRYFGGSTLGSTITQQGLRPTNVQKLRNFINPWNHVADIKTVLYAIRGGALGEHVDVDSIALWGTSFAGGHALRVAADLGPSVVKAVISQVPHLDGKAASKRGIADRGVVGTLKVALLSSADFLLSHVLGFEPIYVKISGLKSDVAYMMLSPVDLLTYFGKHPAKYMGGWQNLAPARTLAIMSLYNPIEAVKDVKVPILFIGALQDTLCPILHLREAAALATHSQSRLVEVDSSHFGVYSGDLYTQISDEMVGFLKLHLLTK